MKILRKFSIFTENSRYQNNENMLDYQISWDFVTKIVDFSEDDFPKVRKKLAEKLELEEIRSNSEFEKT